MRIVLIRVARSVGTLCRYLLQSALQNLPRPTIPFGTVAVNLVGCFAFGFAWSLAEEKFK